MFDLFEADRPSERKNLKPYQTKPIELLRDQLGCGIHPTVVGAPTGFEETLTAAKIIEGALATGSRVIFTVPAITLINQSVAAFEAEGITDIGVMQSNHPRTNAAARVQVCSVQTLAKRKIPTAALVLVDEAHLRSVVIDKMMDERPDVFFVGLSATPWAKGMGLRWQTLVTPVTIGALIEQGYLSTFKVFAPDIPDLSKVKTSKGDFETQAIEDIMAENKLVSNVVGNWLQHGENRPTLCFAVNRKHAAVLASEFAAKGVASGYCDAFTDAVERQMRWGESKVTCSVRTLTNRVDQPARIKPHYRWTYRLRDKFAPSIVNFIIIPIKKWRNAVATFIESLVYKRKKAPLV
jgi:DNA repair protein RadD